jgi:hypothetical protein
MLKTISTISICWLLYEWTRVSFGGLNSTNITSLAWKRLRFSSVECRPMNMSQHLSALTLTVHILWNYHQGFTEFYTLFICKILEAKNPKNTIESICPLWNAQIKALIFWIDLIHNLLCIVFKDNVNALAIVGSILIEQVVLQAANTFPLLFLAMVPKPTHHNFLSSIASQFTLIIPGGAT